MPSPQRCDRPRQSILLTPSLSAIPSSSLVTSSTTSSFILPDDHPDPTAYPRSADVPASTWLPSLRSVSSMRGLLLAETGGSMVELDVYAQPGASGFRVGQTIEQGILSPGGSTDTGTAFEVGKRVWREDTQDKPTRRGTWRGRRGTTSHDVGLSASDTLLQISAPPHRSTIELRVLLGNSAFRLKRNASVIPPPAVSSASPSTADHDLEALALEKAKPHARVELDIVLESETCVQGNALKGHITIHVRKISNSPILLSKAKVRVVGYEAIPHGNTRCTFYQCTALLSHVAPAWDSVLACPPDQDGWAEAKVGVHILPFSLVLPADGSCGIAKGTLDVHSGVALKYFAMASVRLKDSETSQESVAHFYRACEIWPRLSFSAKLSPAPRPLVSEAARTVFMGGSGKIRLSAVMHRLYWIAGQRCVVHLRVVNESKRTVKGASITLVRTTTVFKPFRGIKGNADTDPDACETSTIRKVVAASVLVMGQKCSKGHASAKGWWTGVRPCDTADFAHHIVLPHDALSVARVRLLEVEYTLNVNVTTGGLSSDIEVTLPIRIINFLSIDPPPTSTISQLHGRLRIKPQLGTRNKTWYHKSRNTDGVEETVPGMKYLNAEVTVVAQEDETGPGVVSQAAHDESGESSSIYPSESASTITRHLNVTTSLDEIDRVIGTDSRIFNFVTEAGQLTGQGSTDSFRFSVRGPRGPRLASLPEAVSHQDPQQKNTPQKHFSSNTLPDHVESVRPFIGRRPSITGRLRC